MTTRPAIVHAKDKKGCFLNPEALKQSCEVGMEWQFDKGKQGFHVAVGKGKGGWILINSLGARETLVTSPRAIAYADVVDPG